jgi:predicted Mrr-cat superfamily restriction endonuclease
MTQIEIKKTFEIAEQKVALNRLADSYYMRGQSKGDFNWDVNNKEWISKESLIKFLNEHRKEIDFDDELRDEFNRGVNWMIAQLKISMERK